MKNILLIISLLFVTTSFAASRDLPDYGWYTGFSFGAATDTGEGTERLSGPAGGLAFGYRWDGVALEFNYDYFKLSSEGGLSNYHMGQQLYIDKAEIQGHSFAVSLKGFLFRYFMLGIGLGSFKGQHDFKFHDPADPSNSFVFQDDASYVEVMLQFGIVLPLYRHLDLRIFYDVRSLATTDIDLGTAGNTYEPQVLSTSIGQIAGQVIFYFN